MTLEEIRKIPGVKVLTTEEAIMELFKKIVELDQRLQVFEHIMADFCVCGKVKI